MNIGDLKETLTKKYGPLPGYAYVGIGAAAIFILARNGKKNTASTSDSNYSASVSPLSAGGLDSGGGGGGGLTPDLSGLAGTDLIQTGDSGVGTSGAATNVGAPAVATMQTSEPVAVTGTQSAGITGSQIPVAVDSFFSSGSGLFGGPTLQVAPVPGQSAAAKAGGAASGLGGSVGKQSTAGAGAGLGGAVAVPAAPQKDLSAAGAKQASTQTPFKVLPGANALIAFK